MTPFAGVASSSRRTSSNLRPFSTPPFAFSSSIAMVRPRVIASPARADWPDSAVTRPILIGSCAAAGSAAAPSATAAATLRNERLWDMDPSLWKKRVSRVVTTQATCQPAAAASRAVIGKTREGAGLCPSPPYPARARQDGAPRTRTAHSFRSVTIPLPATSAHKTPAPFHALRALRQSDSEDTRSFRDHNFDWRHHNEAGIEIRLAAVVGRRARRSATAWPRATHGPRRAERHRLPHAHRHVAGRAPHGPGAPA